MTSRYWLVAASLPCLLAAGCLAQAAKPADACGGLAELTIAGARVVAAHVVAAGEFVPPTPPAPGPGAPPMYKRLPAFCRVEAVAKPSSDSDIKIEVWMPVSGWNGKLLGQGNGGFAGDITYGEMALSVANGFVGAATDTGHQGTGVEAGWALGHPEKVLDFGHRAIHEMTRVAKAAVFSYYGKDPQRAYFVGCSNGGRAALMEAQRYPEDYDGILAGAPANNWTHLLTSSIWDAQATTLDTASYIPSSKLGALAAAVNQACDAQDGVADGILSDPRACRFDPGVLKCEAAESDNCLTGTQVTALKKLYDGAHDSRGRRVFPGFLPGAELGGNGWATWITGRGPGRSLLFAFGTGFFSNFVYGKADWDYRSVSLDEAVKAADDTAAAALNATDPNLSAYQRHGGKLVLYHGWNDPAISALSTVDYFNAVVHQMGQRNRDSFLRLYMVPGMQHCAGGPGTDSFGQFNPGAPSDAQHNLFLELEQWVEHGTAPERLVGTKFANGDPASSPQMTRPLCPYPQHARYKGAGDTNDAANFVCVAAQ